MCPFAPRPAVVENSSESQWLSIATFYVTLSHVERGNAELLQVELVKLKAEMHPVSTSHNIN
jgi:hypothetical protein